MHECAISRISIEDHLSFLIYVRRLFRCADADIHQVLKQCEDKLSSLTIDALRGIVYEIWSSHDVDGGEEAFNNSIRSSISYVRTELDDLMIEQRDEVISRRCSTQRKRKTRASDLSDNTDASA